MADAKLKPLTSKPTSAKRKSIIKLKAAFRKNSTSKGSVASLGSSFTTVAGRGRSVRFAYTPGISIIRNISNDLDSVSFTVNKIHQKASLSPHSSLPPMPTVPEQQSPAVMRKTHVRRLAMQKQVITEKPGVLDQTFPIVKETKPVSLLERGRKVRKGPVKMHNLNRSLFD